MPENCAFGGVSVIAVGDFYQLPPVRTKRTDKLYVNDPANPMNQLWIELFSIVELDEIMRQKEDGSFALLLNRLRVKKGNETLSVSDRETLQQCIREGPLEALHIFSTNEEINAYNNDMILKTCPEPKLIEAEDFDKKKASGKLLKRDTHFTKSDICLRSSLLLAEGARVMLIRNEDVHDGLVNGVMGTIAHIGKQSGSSLPAVIYIHFDNENVGKNAKLQKVINDKRCVGLHPSTEDVPMKNGVRKQYPLQLAWACTVHKVQGLTVKECVVDLNKCFAPGQAYVALSRVTSINGLYINDMDVRKFTRRYAVILTLKVAFH
ncbi:ATP-dependent DNA helicase PIF1-like [Saccostrea cucullata]|uniref:ATP-dependent DNA helicase PIF1-like n=1 Tax=Saccostrea cuccullata TaxID=36930 RepID=UPI002ED0AA43